MTSLHRPERDNPAKPRTALCGHSVLGAVGRTRKKCDACLKASEPPLPGSWFERQLGARWRAAFEDAS